MSGHGIAASVIPVPACPCEPPPRVLTRRVVAEYAKRSRLVSDLTKAAQMAAAREQQREAMLREAVESADRRGAWGGLHMQRRDFDQGRRARARAVPCRRARKEARRARAAQDVGRDRQQTDTVEAARKAEAAERGTKKLRFKIDTLERALRQRRAVPRRAPD